MCRLLGVSFGDTAEDLDASEIAGVMFPLLVRQGPHAYGWMTYNEESGEIQHWKQAGPADTSEAHDNIWDNVDPDAKWFVGHTRWATHGSPQDNRNNHPVPHGNIIGVHNGVLRNHAKILAVTGREDPKTEVDSEAIFAAINKWGHVPGLRRIQGDMVTIYADRRRPQYLRIGRSSGRQITLGWTDRGNLIFASDKFALEALQPEITFTKFSTVSENRLLTIRDGEIIKRQTYKERAAAKSFETMVHTPRRFDTRPQAMPALFTQGEVTALNRLHEAAAAIERRRFRAAQEGIEDALTMMQEDRAQRRGQILFPAPEEGKSHSNVTAAPTNRPMGKKQRRRAKRAMAVKPKNTKVFLEGKWVSYDELERAYARLDEETSSSSLDEPFDPGVAYGD